MAIGKQSLGLGTSDPVASYKRIHVALKTQWYKVHGGKPILGVQEETNTIIMLPHRNREAEMMKCVRLGRRTPPPCAIHD
jgi:hypothetical protein